MNKLSTLNWDDDASVDPSRLWRLQDELGHDATQAIVNRALEEIAVRVARVSDFAAAGCTDDAAKLARGLIGIALEVGLVDLARVARDVHGCANRRDYAAQAATIARLQRVTDQSLTSIWDAQDILA